MICGDGNVPADATEASDADSSQHGLNGGGSSTNIDKSSTSVDVSVSPRTPPRSPPVEIPKWADESIPLADRLFLATAAGDSQFARTVIARPDIRGRELLYSVRNEDQETLLHVAARVANFEMARILIGSTDSAPSPGFIDHKSALGETAMHIALSTFNFQAAQMLVACGVDLTQKNASDENILYAASYVNALEVIQTLLSTAEQSENLKKKIVKCLHEVNCDGLTAANIATIKNHTEVVSLLSHFAKK